MATEKKEENALTLFTKEKKNKTDIEDESTKVIIEWIYSTVKH